MSPPKILNFITGNANKLVEVRSILCEGPDRIEGLTLSSKAVDVPEIQGSIEEIASAKARGAAASVSST